MPNPDPLTTLRARMEAMTPGEWRTGEETASPMIFAPKPEWKASAVLAQTIGRGAQPNRVNALGIVTAVRLARAVAEPGTREKLKEAIYKHCPFYITSANAADEVIALLASLALEEGAGHGG